ncbi:MAG: DUF4386 domain-containing protein [Candidatus Acidiferrales bacterium]
MEKRGVSSTKKAARVAGILYLFVVVTAAFSVTYVPSKLIVRGNTAATVHNIHASQSLYRLGIASGLISATIFIFLALALYRLLKGVNQRHAALMVILVLIQVPITFLNAVNHLAALTLLRGADFLSAFDKPQRDALAMLFLNLHDQGIIVAQIFWGLWLFPFGSLVYRSEFLPRILGAWLIINGIAYLALSFTGLLLPQFYTAVFNSALPAALGQMAMMLWLLIVGAKDQPLGDSTA